MNAGLLASAVGQGMSSFADSYLKGRQLQAQQVAQEEQRSMARRSQKMQEREKGLLWNAEKDDYDQDPVGTGNIQAKRQMDAAKDYFDTLKSQYSALDEDQKYSPDGQRVLKEMNSAASQLSALQRRMMGTMTPQAQGVERQPDDAAVSPSLPLAPQAKPSPVVMSGQKPPVRQPAPGVLAGTPQVPQTRGLGRKAQRDVQKQVALEEATSDLKVAQEVKKKTATDMLTAEQALTKLDVLLGQLTDPKKSDEEKRVIGQESLKLINSIQSIGSNSDAVGAEEVKRIGALLQTHIWPNFSGVGPVVGRAPISDFTKQVENNRARVKDYMTRMKNPGAELKQVEGKTYKKVKGGWEEIE